MKSWLYRKFHWACFIQADYLIKDEALAKRLEEKRSGLLQVWGGKAEVYHFKLTEGGPYVNAVLDPLYSAELRKCEGEICRTLEEGLHAEAPECRAIIKGIIR